MWDREPWISFTKVIQEAAGHSTFPDLTVLLDASLDLLSEQEWRSLSGPSYGQLDSGNKSVSPGNTLTSSQELGLITLREGRSVISAQQTGTSLQGMLCAS